MRILVNSNYNTFKEVIFMPGYLSLLKKPLPLSDAIQYPSIDKVVIDSIEQALFSVEIEIAGDAYYITEKSGHRLTRRSILAIQKLFIPVSVKSMFLRHNSPYDEMIGQSESASSNELLVPLGNYFSEDDISVNH